jgi:hypothetical protein
VIFVGVLQKKENGMRMESFFAIYADKQMFGESNTGMH